MRPPRASEQKPINGYGFTPVDSNQNQNQQGVYLPVVSELKGHYERMSAMPPKQKAMHKIKGCGMAIGGGAILLSILCILAGEWAMVKGIIGFSFISMCAISCLVWAVYMAEK